MVMGEPERIDSVEAFERVGAGRPHAHPSPAAEDPLSRCVFTANAIPAPRGAVSAAWSGRWRKARQGADPSNRRKYRVNRELEPAERLAALRLVVQLRAGTPHQGRVGSKLLGLRRARDRIRSCVRGLRPRRPFMGLPEIVELKHRSSPGHGDVGRPLSGCRGLSRRPGRIRWNPRRGLRALPGSALPGGPLIPRARRRGRRRRRPQPTSRGGPAATRP